jgi:hypothetical protein
MGTKGAGELEIEYPKVSQGISRLGTAQKELGSWKLSISSYLQVSQGISRYLKVSQGSERPKRSI